MNREVAIPAAIALGAGAGLLAYIFVPIMTTTICSGCDIPHQLPSIRLAGISVDSAHSTGKTLYIKLVFSVNNPTLQPVTISYITYAVAANDIPVGNGNLSYEDVPVNGRPALLAWQSTNVNSTFQIHHSDSIDNILFDKIRSDPSSVKWRLIGNLVVATSLTEADVRFNDTK